MASTTPEDELRVAVAVTGASTEAVAMDARNRLLVRAEGDATGDLAPALASVIRQVVAVPEVDAALVTRVMLGTGDTLTRALEQRAVDRVAVIRIGSPLTQAVPPLSAWPPALRDAVSAGEVVVGGGADYDGRPSAALDEQEVARFLGTLDDAVDAVAIIGIFSPVAPDQELAATELVRRELGSDIRISLSHELGMLGLIERENATILNAALAGAAQRVAAALEDALGGQRIAADPFVSINDGALVALQLAQRLPVLMLDSGPANAMRGAVHLSGAGGAVVVNAPGAAIEVGTVVHGVPRETVSPVEAAGVRLGFRMPEVRRLPPDATASGLREAIARAGGDLGAPPVLAVGRDRDIVPNRLRGLGPVIRPAAGEVAAAVGAAIAEVTGRADRISQDRPDRQQEALEAAREEAIALAVHAGADPDRLHVVGVDEKPLTYDVEPVVRIGVTVAGPPV
jgi:hypothetical protein